jgi:hypothetical protein
VLFSKDPNDYRVDRFYNPPPRPPALFAAPRGGRLHRGWKLTAVAFRIMRRDRTLIALTAISAVTSVALLLAFFLVGGLLDDGYRWRGTQLLWLFAFAWPGSFLAAFENVALAAAAGAALDGKPLTLGQALGFPLRRIRAVLAWSLLNAAVIVAIEGVAARIPFGGRVLARLGDVGWSLASLFAIPILVLEGLGPLQAVRRSAQLARERWGEAITGSVAITLWAGIPAALGLLAVVVGLDLHDVAVRVALVSGGVALVALAGGVAQAAQGVFDVALYRYAIDPEDAAVGAFPTADLAAAPSGLR